MPFRFRRTISLGKGFRLNLSKSGISSTIGGKGVHVNVGKRGIRPTISAPGTGLSYTPSTASTSNTKASKSTKTITTALVSFILICIISICCVGVIFSDSNETATPTALVEVLLATKVYGTSSAAKTQTRSASTLIVAPNTPTSFVLPTQEVRVVSVIPDTLAPTWTPLPTSTPFVLASATSSGSASPSVIIVAVNKSAEYVDIKNTGSVAVNLKGWTLVSERGNQRCGLSGILEPGQTLRIWAGTNSTGFSCGFGNNIWNNSESDPAVLLDPQGQEADRY